jgi:hypothetical protein
VVLDGAVRGKVDYSLWDDDSDKGHDVDLYAKINVGLEEFAAAQFFGWVCGGTLLLSQSMQGVALTLIEYPDYVFTLLQQTPVDRLAKSRLSYESYSHVNTSWLWFGQVALWMPNWTRARGFILEAFKRP